MKKNILLALAAMIFFSQGIARSQEIKPNINNPVEVDTWLTQKQKLVERAICWDLESDVSLRKNPATYHLSYEVLAQESKKRTAPRLLATTSIPYSEKNSFEKVSTPSIESLDCTKTVEMWRGMYEYKTIPYVKSDWDTWNPVFEVIVEIFKWGSYLLGFLIFAYFAFIGYVTKR